MKDGEAFHDPGRLVGSETAPVVAGDERERLIAITERAFRAAYEYGCGKVPAYAWADAYAEWRRAVAETGRHPRP